MKEWKWRNEEMEMKGKHKECKMEIKKWRHDCINEWDWEIKDTNKLKIENIDQVEVANKVSEQDLFDYSITSESTGSKKWFFIPQISYSKNGLTVFATSEIPLYQNLNGVQVGSQNQFTLGVNYRFLTKE